MQIAGRSISGRTGIITLCIDILQDLSLLEVSNTMAEGNSNRIVLITGATRGLGRALALEFASSGCKLLLCGRNRCHLQTLSEELPNSSNHVLKAVDVSEEEEVTRWKEELIREELIPDLLVNNAAIGIKGGFWKMPKEDFDKVISINLLGGLINATIDTQSNLLKFVCRYCES